MIFLNESYSWSERRILLLIGILVGCPFLALIGYLMDEVRLIVLAGVAMCVGLIQWFLLYRVKKR